MALGRFGLPLSIEERVEYLEEAVNPILELFSGLESASYSGSGDDVMVGGGISQPGYGGLRPVGPLRIEERVDHLEKVVKPLLELYSELDSASHSGSLYDAANKYPKVPNRIPISDEAEQNLFNFYCRFRLFLLKMRIGLPGTVGQL
jgi:hypothetical protein